MSTLDLSPAALRKHAEGLREWGTRLGASPDASYFDLADLLEAIAARDEAASRSAVHPLAEASLSVAVGHVRAFLANIGDSQGPRSGWADREALHCSGVAVTYGDLAAIARYAERAKLAEPAPPREPSPPDFPGYSAPGMEWSEAHSAFVPVPAQGGTIRERFEAAWMAKYPTFPLVTNAPLSVQVLLDVLDAERAGRT